MHIDFILSFAIYTYTKLYHTLHHQRIPTVLNSQELLTRFHAQVSVSEEGGKNEVNDFVCCLGKLIMKNTSDRDLKSEARSNVDVNQPSLILSQP